jgi:hypothetical protein
VEEEQRKTSTKEYAVTRRLKQEIPNRKAVEVGLDDWIG